MFPDQQFVSPPSDLAPQLVVVVDTEEEFDWDAEPDPKARGVASMNAIGRVQRLFDEYGIVPCYVIDHPVASQPEGIDALKPLLEAGRCEIGAHLHPWVNPPVREPITRSNMYPGNLPRDMEAEKLQCLRNTITENFGQSPVVYKAGRYGFGGNTAGILQELGFTTDVSVCPPFDARGDGGPDYSRFDARPFWFGEGERLFELPVTGGFVGWAHGLAPGLFNLAQGLRQFRAPGILARLGAVDRLMLSPEGFTTREHIKLTRFLLNQGVRTFTWSFHSPSVVPGNTPYVRNEADLERFLERFRLYFDFFFNELGGQASTPTRIKNLTESW